MYLCKQKLVLHSCTETTKFYPSIPDMDSEN